MGRGEKLVLLTAESFADPTAGAVTDDGGAHGFGRDDPDHPRLPGWQGSPIDDDTATGQTGALVPDRQKLGAAADPVRLGQGEGHGRGRQPGRLTPG